MLELINRALAIAEKDHARKLENGGFEARLESLSRRETEILREVVRGKQSKIIAYELGISEKTVDVHRTSIRRKFRTKNPTPRTKLAMIQAKKIKTGINGLIMTSSRDLKSHSCPVFIIF